MEFGFYLSSKHHDKILSLSVKNASKISTEVKTESHAVVFQRSSGLESVGFGR